MISDYARLVMSSEITLDEVPDAYTKEVNAIVTADNVPVVLKENIGKG